MSETSGLADGFLRDAKSDFTMNLLDTDTKSARAVNPVNPEVASHAHADCPHYK